jgi:hypothetical protein
MLYFNVAIFLFYFFSIGIIFFIILYLIIISRRKRVNHIWEILADELISQAIFTDPEDNNKLITISEETQKLLLNPRFLVIISNKIISTTKNISGQSHFYLQKLFIQLNLDLHSLKLLDSYQWHKKAKAIQEIGIMRLNKYLPQVSAFTNYSNELVRMEAQITLLKLTGFDGLKFLDTVTQTISEWEQIMLLKELAVLPLEQFIGINNWLKSSNDSVIIFALKLARNYHKFELYEDIFACLNHNSATVRLNAIHTLAEVYNQDTAIQLLQYYIGEEYANQLAIVKALQDIGDEESIESLISFLNTDNFEMKFTLARAIANISNNSLEKLAALPEANVYPLKDMLSQINSEINP